MLHLSLVAIAILAQFEMVLLGSLLLLRAAALLASDMPLESVALPGFVVPFAAVGFVVPVNFVAIVISGAPLHIQVALVLVIEVAAMVDCVELVTIAEYR